VNDLNVDEFPPMSRSRYIAPSFAALNVISIRHADNHEAYVPLDDKTSACNTHQPTITDASFIPSLIRY